MKKILILNVPLLLLLFLTGCQLERTARPAPPDHTVKIIRHSDLPIRFDDQMRGSQIRQFLVQLNRYRHQKGLPPLTLDKKLQRAAQWMSDDMAAKNYLSHQDSKGRDPFDRMEAFGYTYNTDMAENVAAGQKTADEVLKSWQSSQHHNKNMLNPKYTAIGIGFSYNKKSKYGWYWATSFGGTKSR